MMALLLAAALGGVYTVSPGESIQTALDQAAWGDTVLLLPGTHGGAGLHLAELTGAHDGVTLLGDPQSPQDVVLDGSALDECVILVDGTLSGEVGPSTVIRGITFRYGDSGADPFGGGIRMNHASPVIDLCVFDQCQADNGGGMYVWKGTPKITGCTFTDCHTESAGAGIYLYRSDATISGCRFQGCGSNDDGGGVYMYHSSPTIFNCLFVDGWANDDGPAVYCYTLSTPDVGNCTFTGGGANGDGAGVYFRVESGGYIHDNIVADNATTAFCQKGGADPVFSHNCVWNNAGGHYVNLPDPTGQEGNIEADPLFTGDWYLSSTGAGQPQQSPCVDTGSVSAAAAGLAIYWTRTDSLPDSGTVDMGYHHGPPEEWMGIEPHAGQQAPALIARPCPTIGSLSLSCGGRSIRLARVVDLAGRTVFEAPETGASLNMDLPPELPSGVYLVTAIVEGAPRSTSVVLVRR